MDKLEVLKRSDLFRELNDEQLNSVAEMCACEVYEPGTIIHKQNQMLDKLYIIEEGLVGIMLEPGPLSQRQLQAACNFETFGWSAIIPPHQSTATVKTMERTKVLAFKGQELADLCSTNCRLGCIVYRGIAKVIADRLHAAYMQLLGVTSQD
jgi:signal-transduction protein with cAMP-binding, CBS, and nucleotidyltransferase domain